MRDVVWTLIIIWVVFKLISIFKSSSQKKPDPYSQKETQTTDNSFVKKDAKEALKKGVNKEGEYIDYEEIN